MMPYLVAFAKLSIITALTVAVFVVFIFAYAWLKLDDYAPAVLSASA